MAGMGAPNSAAAAAAEDGAALGQVNAGLADERTMNSPGCGTGSWPRQAHYCQVYLACC